MVVPTMPVTETSINFKEKQQEIIQIIKQKSLKIDEGIDFETSRSEIIELANVWDIITDEYKDAPSFFQKTLDSIKKATIVFQKQMFPVYRSALGFETNKKLWKIDCGCYVSNSSIKNAVIDFWGNEFLRNQDKLDAFNQLKNTLYQFRFHGVRYKWLKSDEADDESSFSLQSPYDDAPVIHRTD